eukprot:TRINITY_DN10572_c0_g1_i1.p1 TRINITY_DN10572_c0_g1~~TRINITY_DN10572_c0_g1_i1.p1  ORF type:complete len:104 (-),score=1.04 TRINITY_DN10572_c0_g1_i1:19-330(-)
MGFLKTLWLAYAWLPSCGVYTREADRSRNNDDKHAGSVRGMAPLTLCRFHVLVEAMVVRFSTVPNGPSAWIYGRQQGMLTVTFFHTLSTTTPSNSETIRDRLP